MTASRLSIAALCCLMAGLAISALLERPDARNVVPAGRTEVVFWHFWGGEDREVVEQLVERFNRGQDQYFVRAIAMPGNNLEVKLFLAVTGGDPPDVINLDDPIMADWAKRGALTPLEELATAEEVQDLQAWLVPAARRLGSYRGKMYALCNGLDVRAIYYNKTLLDRQGLQPPRTLDELDALAEQLTQRDENGQIVRFGYLPDPRRLWAWGIVFGGLFHDTERDEVTADDPRIVAALEWMVGYRERYGRANVAAFRQGDQSMPGKTFPLLADRYAMVMDGQWRVRDILASQQEARLAGRPVTEYGVYPLPPPTNGVSNAGWVNGNFFLVPRGAGNREGAWAFMKFWSGFGGHEEQAARSCVAGGWIPVSPAVAQQPAFQRFLDKQPLFAAFVELAGEPDQIPTPVIPGAGFFYRRINDAATTALYVEDAPPPQQLLQEATRDIQKHLSKIGDVER